MQPITHMLISHKRTPSHITRQVRQMGRAVLLNGKVCSAASGPARALFKAQIGYAKRLLTVEGYRVFDPPPPGIDSQVYEVQYSAVGVDPDSMPEFDPRFEPGQQDGRS